MKNTKFFVSTLIAAAAMTATAYGVGETKTISLNFTYGNTGTISSGEAGLFPVLSSEWKNINVQSADSTNHSLTTGESITVTSVGGWQSDTSLNETSSGNAYLLKGYLDVSNHNESQRYWGVEVSNISYLVYDVYVYLAGDSDGAQFASVSINGQSYIGATAAEGGSMTVASPTSWGSCGETATSLELGVNAIKVSDVSGANVVLTNDWVSTGTRATLAGIQIVNTYAGEATNVDFDGDNISWTDSSIGNTGWENSTVNEGTYAAFELTTDTSVNVTGDGIITDGITVSGSGVLTLSGNAITLIGPGVIRADDDAASVSITNDVTFTSGALLSGNVSLTGNVEITGGALALNATKIGETTSVSVANGAVLDVGEISAAKTDLTSVGGSGTLSFIGTDVSHNSGITLGENFTGTVLVSGNVNLPRDSELGGATKVILKNAYWWSGETKAYTQAFEIQGTYTEGQARDKFGGNQWRGSGNITFNGVVTLAENASLAIEQGTYKFDGGFTGAAGSTLYVGRDANTASSVTFTKRALDSTTFAEGSSIIVSSGGILTLGENLSTMDADRFGENLAMTVGGTGKVEFSLAENTEKEYAGSVTLNDGGWLNKWDGGLKLTGAVKLGDSAESVTTISSRWQKSIGIEIAGALSGQGTTYVYNVQGGKTETVTISGSDNSYSGTLILGKRNADTDADGITKLVVSNNTALQNASVNLAGGGKAQLVLGANNVTLSGLSGTADSKVTTTVSDPDKPTLTITGGGDFAGVIAPGGAGLLLEKTGTETLTLSGVNNYKGGTRILEGLVIAANNNALGNAVGTVTISGGQLSVSQNVTLAQTAITIVLSDTYNTENSEKIAAISGAGAFADGTTIALDKATDAVALSLVAEAPQKYSYQIFDPTSSLVGTDWTFELGSAWDGWEQSYDTASGVLTLTIPEPSAFGLLAGVGALALCVSRRRRVKKA